MVKCPSAFPISSKPSKKRPNPSTAPNKRTQSAYGRKKKDPSLLDWHDTVKEIRSYGAKSFEGKQKRDFEDEEYYKLTGHHKKKPKTPLPIVRGIKKAAAWKEAKARDEARKAGIVLPKAKKESQKDDSIYRNYGPAPSIGFMKDGMFRVKMKDEKR